MTVGRVSTCERPGTATAIELPVRGKVTPP